MKVYFDENFSEYIAEAFNLLEKTKGKIEVFSTHKELYRSASDKEIVIYVAKQKGVLFSKDRDFKKAKLITELMESYKIGFFYMKTPKVENYWDTVSKITKAYLRGREIILNKKIPYYYEIMSNGGIKKRSL